MADTYSVGTQYDTAATAAGNGTVIALLKLLTNQMAAGGVGNQVQGTTDNAAAATTIKPILIGVVRNSDSTLNRWIGGVPADAVTNSAVYPYAQGLLSAYNGATWDRLRVASSSEPSLRTAVLVAESLSADALSSNPARQIDGLGVSRLGALTSWLFNGTTWDRPRSPGLGTAAVGKFRVTITNSPTVGTGTAYANNDVIGTLQTLSAVFRLANGAALLKTVTISSKNAVADIAIGIRVWFFNANPSGSTFTDNAALDIVDADITKVLGWVEIPTGAAATSGQVWSKGNLDLHLVAASAGTGLHVVMQAMGAIAANAGTTDFQLTLGVEQE